MLQMALTFAKQYDARILFYQVQHAADFESVAGIGLKQVKQMITTEDEDWCKIEYEKEPGDPAEQILRKAQEEKVDLIFMGHHTRKPLALNILGSVALKVVREASCPVMVIRE
jgi:nucleotide-binding universal stress UspA family protein